MTDFMCWTYANYIKPYIENQPKDREYEMLFDLLNNELDTNLQNVLQSLLAYHATQGFRLGVCTGVTLTPDL